ncbi:MAG: hypothetical protein KH939_03670 [Firmicutes bacterium]|nr:hypothetical protein [Bacillota bacterium]
MIHTSGAPQLWRTARSLKFLKATSRKAVKNGWMNSPGHRSNILSSDFAYIGVGCYEANGRLYWTQIFAG